MAATKIYTGEDAAKIVLVLQTQYGDLSKIIEGQKSVLSAVPSKVQQPAEDMALQGNKKTSQAIR